MDARQREMDRTKVLLAVVAILYWVTCVRTKDGMVVLQAPLRSLSPEHLVEGYPLVIPDRLVQRESLRSTVFRWSHVFSRDHVHARDRVGVVQGRFGVMFKDDGMCEIDVINPCSLRGQFTRRVENERTGRVRVRLHPGQTLVLPHRWRYVVLSDAVYGWTLYDVSSALFHVLIGWTQDAGRRTQDAG